MNSTASAIALHRFWQYPNEIFESSIFTLNSSTNALNSPLKEYIIIQEIMVDINIVPELFSCSKLIPTVQSLAFNMCFSRT